MYQLYKNHKLMVLLLFFWVSIWASLNTYPIGVGTFLNSLNQSSSFKNDLITLLSFFRFYIPIVIFAAIRARGKPDDFATNGTVLDDLGLTSKTYRLPP